MTVQIALTGQFEGGSGPFTIRYYAKLPTLANDLTAQAVAYDCYGLYLETDY